MVNCDRCLLSLWRNWEGRFDVTKLQSTLANVAGLIAFVIAHGSTFNAWRSTRCQFLELDCGNGSGLCWSKFSVFKSRLNDTLCEVVERLGLSFPEPSDVCGRCRFSGCSSKKGEEDMLSYGRTGKQTWRQKMARKLLKLLIIT